MPNAWQRGMLYQLLDEFDDLLEAGSLEHINHILTAYGMAFEASKAQFELLVNRVAADIATGKTFSIDRLRRMTYYQDLMEQTTRRMSDFSVYGASETARGQAWAIAQAQEQAAALYEAALAEDLAMYPARVGRGALPAGMTLADLRAMHHQLPSGALDALIGFTGDGTPLRQYFLAAHIRVPSLTNDVVQRIEDALTRGLATGMNPRVVAGYFDDAMGVGLERALRIARTEILRAHRITTQADMLANSDVISGYRRSAALGPTTCAACISLDGSIHPLDEVMTDHPNGGCRAVPVTIYNEGQVPLRRIKNDDGTYDIVEADGATWFEGLQDAQKERIMGGAAFRAYKAGELDLSDMLGQARSETFGTSPQVRSLKDILGERASEYYARPGAVQEAANAV